MLAARGATNSTGSTWSPPRRGAGCVARPVTEWPGRWDRPGAPQRVRPRRPPAPVRWTVLWNKDEKQEFRSPPPSAAAGPAGPPGRLAQWAGGTL